MTIHPRPRIRIGEVAVLPRFVDWPVIVIDIKTALGLVHDSQVAELVNIPISTLRAYLDRGSEPLYWCGAAIIELHTRACGLDQTQLRLREFRERATRSPS